MLHLVTVSHLPELKEKKIIYNSIFNWSIVKCHSKDKKISKLKERLLRKIPFWEVKTNEWLEIIFFECCISKTVILLRLLFCFTSSPALFIKQKIKKKRPPALLGHEFFVVENHPV